VKQRSIPGTGIVRFVVTTSAAVTVYRIERKVFAREMVRYFVEANGLRWPKKSSGYEFFETWRAAHDALLLRLDGDIEKARQVVVKLAARHADIMQMREPGTRRATDGN